MGLFTILLVIISTFMHAGWNLIARKNRNEIKGLAIIEAPATTLPISKGKKVVVDEYKRFWIKES